MDAASAHREPRVGRALAYMGVTAGAFAVLNASAKLLAADYPVVEVVWARTLGHLLFVTLAFGPAHGPGLFRTRHPRIQVLRSLLLLGSTAFNFVALRFIPLANASAILFTAPLLVTLLAAPVLGERVGLQRWAAIGVGFVGMLIVVRPGTDVVDLASLLALGSAACYALYQLLTRRVAGTDPPETTASYSALVGTGIMCLLVPFAWVTPRSLGDLGLFLSLGLTGALGHYCVARAYQWGPASVVSPFNYLQLLGAATMGYVVFGDVPGPAVWAGATLIVAAGLAVAYAEHGRPGRA